MFRALDFYSFNDFDPNCFAISSSNIDQLFNEQICIRLGPSDFCKLAYIFCINFNFKEQVSYMQDS